MEEIIIDGIDVSECYADKTNLKDGLYCFWEGGSCEDNEYCYYKQLKRLKKINKANADSYVKYQGKYLKEISELKAECEKLKKQLSCSTEFPGQCHCAFRCLGNDWCDEAENRFIKYKEENIKLKQALEKIEEKVKYLQRCQKEFDYVDLNCIIQIIKECKE